MVGLVMSAAPQGLAPDVLLLARVTTHARQELARLPNCSCLETVRREHQLPGAKMRLLDTIRLEVLYNGGRELYASPGDRGFGDNHPIAFAGSGTLGNGFFALYLKDVFSEGRVSYLYKGEETVNGRHLAHFEFRVPVSVSSETIQLVEGSGAVGMRGSFWADPLTYDVVSIAMEASEIPPTLPITASETSIDYARTNLGGDDFLLPQSADYELVKLNGERSRNHIEFTHCHLFGARSSINFGTREERPQFGASSVLEVSRELLPALHLVVKLTTRITGATTVGALIEGSISGNVTHKGKVLIPDGSTVRGRLRRMEWYPEKDGYFVVGLEFTDIEARGTRYRFFADLEDTDRLPGIESTLRSSKSETRSLWEGSVTLSSSESISLSSLPGVGCFFVRGRQLDLPPGFRTTWKTRALLP
jgi:hypothetical protein